MIDELKCRFYSILDYITGNDLKYYIFDDSKNQYVKGRKIKAHKIPNHGFKEEDGWMHVLTTPDGVKHYWKKKEVKP
jgi:hypothetical protein